MHSIDTSNISDVIFPLFSTEGAVVSFNITFPFVYGQEYYILMDSGKSVVSCSFFRNSNEEYC